jgi:hypothetical protein
MLSRRFSEGAFDSEGFIRYEVVNSEAVSDSRIGSVCGAVDAIARERRG